MGSKKKNFGCYKGKTRTLAPECDEPSLVFLAVEKRRPTEVRTTRWGGEDKTSDASPFIRYLSQDEGEGTIDDCCLRQRAHDKKATTSQGDEAGEGGGRAGSAGVVQGLRPGAIADDGRRQGAQGVHCTAPLGSLPTAPSRSVFFAATGLLSDRQPAAVRLNHCTEDAESTDESDDTPSPDDTNGTRSPNPRLSVRRGRHLCCFCPPSLPQVRPSDRPRGLAWRSSDLGAGPREPGDGAGNLLYCCELARPAPSKAFAGPGLLITKFALRTPCVESTTPKGREARSVGSGCSCLAVLNMAPKHAVRQVVPPHFCHRRPQWPPVSNRPPAVVV